MDPLEFGDDDDDVDDEEEEEGWREEEVVESFDFDFFAFRSPSPIAAALPSERSQILISPSQDAVAINFPVGSNSTCSTAPS